MTVKQKRFWNGWDFKGILTLVSLIGVIYTVTEFTISQKMTVAQNSLGLARVVRDVDSVKKDVDSIKAEVFKNQPEIRERNQDTIKSMLKKLLKK